VPGGESIWKPLLLAAGVLALSLLGWQWLRAAVPAVVLTSDAATSTTMPTAAAPAALQPPASAHAAAVELRHRQLQLWSQRLDRAEHAYQAYRDATRYPPTARPAAEHPGQMQPFAPVQEETALRDAAGKRLPGLTIRTTQDKVYVAGVETVRFTLEAFADGGGAVPLLVRQSSAQSLADTKALVTIVRVPVPFTDDGSGADESAGDGRYSAQLTPANQGFAGQPGTIRLLVELAANGQQGVAAFDIIYVPEVPGTWTGVREAFEEGSLNFYLQAKVTHPGRYVASARVQDAHGTMFALLQYNEVVAAGAVEFRLALPGLLVRDMRPVFPLRLVDVEGFLLKPDTFPDRSLMPRLPGVVHVSRSYNVESFSADEWKSEQRDRYLSEFAREAVRAQDEISRLQR
jgi:hypothetical protein